MKTVSQVNNANCWNSQERDADKRFGYRRLFCAGPENFDRLFILGMMFDCLQLPHT